MILLQKVCILINTIFFSPHQYLYAYAWLHTILASNFKKLDVLLLDFRGIQFITETNIHTLQCYLMELYQYFYYSQTRQYSEFLQTLHCHHHSKNSLQG